MGLQGNISLRQLKKKNQIKLSTFQNSGISNFIFLLVYIYFILQDIKRDVCLETPTPLALIKTLKLFHDEKNQ